MFNYIYFMKKKISQIIKIIGIGLTEIIINIEIDNVTINSIEWVQSNDKIYLHIFQDDNVDIEMDFDDLSEGNKFIVLKTLSEIIYN